MYDYPGGYAKKFNQTSERLGNVVPEGQNKITPMKMEAEEAASTIIEGASNVRTLTPGYKIKNSGDDAWAGSQAVSRPIGEHGGISGAQLHLGDGVREGVPIPQHVHLHSGGNHFSTAAHHAQAKIVRAAIGMGRRRKLPTERGDLAGENSAVCA